MNTATKPQEDSEAPVPVSIRLCELERVAVNVLAASWGTSKAEAMRRAIREAAQRIMQDAAASSDIHGGSTV